MTTALIIGAGQGLSTSLARALHARGHSLILAARDTSDLGGLASETGAALINCDARNRDDMVRLFDTVDTKGPLDVAIYNPSARVRGAVADLDTEAVENAILVTAYGAFLMAHYATKRMQPQGHGALLFTGASAGVKGFANSSAFAMGKFALRGLCQSLARELHPQNIHIGHFVIDGVIAKSTDSEPGNTVLHPDAIAQSYMHFLDQHPSSWAWEIELRPQTERF
ncbi:SDR family NAD(P)-dependent oxidoreductase [Pseudohalocynthiibacter aestuariivivens]|jgi:NAD(P)-dependent dehydrogenase (short-subunit alcohol dehydrogenase family)|uniref:SDR family NAD(P)-dependent oxidoreductase n=1 Tax=Pseudohalocynthiibacter aestuariivivens TaxID=1591409 RepID=A0ABV5JIE0_9RHOB|nr:MULTISPECIES: SDR family NAD(P)-dependent oxidoreductase [Pseudohalocynthiibacter]MBS9717533.1 SDR family NAD(P)-dependent oxidoreductase [Pseudohalocynthiibacter aestuariivivens]MCK0102131.1 SDR family NAD(P)-dependent oxidoreductase [Pseudohalocynthiibacter sp. F2068]